VTGVTPRDRMGEFVPQRLVDLGESVPVDEVP
jgi:hypothetical protein